MTRESTRIVNAVLREMPLDDQLASLICCIIQRRPQALSALVSMSAVLAAMAEHLSARDRIALSEIVRDTADHIEHGRERIPDECWPPFAANH